jgi:predicted phosphate transport protein (TIGR00153 family)
VFSRFHLIPQGERFFEQFNAAAENNHDAARLLVELLAQPEEVERLARQLKDLEHHGDELTHRVFDALNRTFITPLDREDIGALASALDDVIDWIEEAARRIHLYRITEITPLARQFGDIIVQQAQDLAQSIPLVDTGKDQEQLHRMLLEIHGLENEADDLLANALATLYDGVTEVPQMIHAIHWGDIYQLLEDTTDKAEHVAVVLRSIIGKKS